MKSMDHPRHFSPWHRKKATGEPCFIYHKPKRLEKSGPRESGGPEEISFPGGGGIPELAALSIPCFAERRFGSLSVA